MAFKGCKYQAFGDSITEQVKKQVNKTGRRLLLKKIKDFHISSFIRSRCLIWVCYIILYLIMLNTKVRSYAQPHQCFTHDHTQSVIQLFKVLHRTTTSMIVQAGFM